MPSLPVEQVALFHLRRLLFCLLSEFSSVIITYFSELIVVELCGVSYVFLFFLEYLLFYSRSPGVCAWGGRASGAQGEWRSEEGLESAPASQETTAECELHFTTLTGNKVDHIGSFNHSS